jgi:hypothetical protein
LPEICEFRPAAGLDVWSQERSMTRTKTNTVQVRTTEGTVPAHKPVMPCSFTMYWTTCRELLNGLPLACKRVFTRSMGLVTAAANEPLRQPASRFRKKLLELSLLPPKAALMGVYVPRRAPAL